ncbi:MAG: GH92 family glycosyl hydrolase [Bacteroidota bacterium]
MNKSFLPLIVWTTTASVLVLLLNTSCQRPTPAFTPGSDPLAYVDPFIGTGGHGHTYPGANYPFGMVQLSPDTRLRGWDGCSGYHYSDSIIYGFSHTHLSGTGVSDYGDVLLMPVNNGAELGEGDLDYAVFQSPFQHAREAARPGYYEVFLERPRVQVQLSTTPRGGLHHYRFEDPQSPAVVLDLEHRDEVLACDFTRVGDRRIEGYRHSNAWATDQRVFFVIEFSEAVEEVQVQRMAGKENAAKGLFRFAPGTRELTVRVALSPVDLDGARANFEAELAGRDLGVVRSAVETAWRTELRKIEAQCGSETEQVIFYSALYHSMLAPNLYSDVDGRYRGMDQQIHRDSSHAHYTVFSLWDTYRAAHPLYTLIDQKRTVAFIRTMLHKYEQGGILPIWDLSACYTGCMIGYHGVSVIADAYVKGIRDYDTKLALEAVQHSAKQSHLGLDEYQERGFISVEGEAESVSKTLEYAYDDWCIAQLAMAMGERATAEEFYQRSLSYRNLFDPETRFFRPRRYNFWQSPFDPYEVNNNYTEANAWHYGFSAVHDLEGFVALHGGPAGLEAALDSLFAATSLTSGRDQADITGLIGQYAHGNEPSHHIAYLYNYVHQPWKTQARVREILATQYQAAPDGIAGNEDCGQMSAWYVLSALGFYPVLPGSDYYVIGSPVVRSATINLENGRQFKIRTSNNRPEHPYIQAVTLNGEPYERSYLTQETIMAGGEWHFEMGPQPNLDWGSTPETAPPSAVEHRDFVPVPYLAKGQLSFTEQNHIELASTEAGAVIYYSLNGGDYAPYAGQVIILEESTMLCTYAQGDGGVSPRVCTDLIRRDATRSIELQSDYAAIYSGGAADALIDGLRGGDDFRSGGWQGFQGKDLECVVDLSTSRKLQKISCGFLQDENSWIFFPSSVEYYGSEDGVNFRPLGQVKGRVSPREKGVFLENYELALSGTRARYVKVKAKSLIDCPRWHKGALHEGKAWVFADEISIF